jgi:CubicO group peptidase (beta-lactamase class C family)
MNLLSTSSAQESADDRNWIARFEQAVQSEIDAGNLSGVSVALVHDQRVIYARGFGFADKDRKVPATEETVYRAGSISKLFTALGVMQQAERGRLDIDQPITNYLPEFKVVVPFENAKPITLRQLMSHRSGMVRESPVGGYLDDSEPGIERSVASVSDCVLVYPPEARTRYSNIGVTIAGQVMAKVAGQDFVAYQRDELLGPIGMHSSSFLLDRPLKARLAKGYLPVAQKEGGVREIVSPQFELGTIPAGNLYTTAEDLARFLMFLFNEGRAGERSLLQPETLASMFVPQFTTEATGFGHGFSAGKFREHKTIGHMGAVYGFTSALTAVPEKKIGVVILCNDDIAIGPVRKLNNLGLALLLEQSGEPAPSPVVPFERTAAQLAKFEGDYESESFWARLAIEEDGLKANVSGQKLRLIPRDEKQFEGSGRIGHEVAFVFNDSEEPQSFTALGQTFRRVDPARVQKIPEEWKQFLGSYGPKFIPLIITVKHGHLYAMTENEFDYRLTPLNRFVFKMPRGLYTDEELVFQAGANGRVHSAVLANMVLRRTR